MTGEVLVLATGRGGPVGAPVDVRSLEEVKTVLVGGDAALMAIAALQGGAASVTSIRVNDATTATLDLGDIVLSSRVPGQLGDATHVRRDGLHHLTVRNAILGVTEQHSGGSVDDLTASIQRGRILDARPGGGSPRVPRGGTFLDGGIDEPAPEPLRWSELARLKRSITTVVVGSAEPMVVAAVTSARCATDRVYAGPHRPLAKTELTSAAIAIARAAPSARVVCNTVLLEDPQSGRAHDHPSYVLAAYAAGLWASGRHDDLSVRLPRLGFHFDQADDVGLEAAGVIVTRFEQEREVFVLSRL